jgi:hypothetical protein
MTNKEIVLKLKEDLEGDWKYMLGSDDEFSKPHRILKEITPKFKVEISAKTGNSWYYTGCDGIKMITLGYYRGYNAKFYCVQFKLLDFSSDYDIILKWVKEACSKSIINEQLEEHRSEVVERLHEAFKDIKTTIKPVNIQYTLNDPDREFESLTVDIKLAEKDNVRTSLIVQSNLYDDGTIKDFYSVRKLSISKCPELISLDDEKELTPDETFADIIEYIS